MKVFGVAGSSGMGKTTLLASLVPMLVARGLVVSMVKHSHKDIEIDRPGKDSFRLREAGCHEVMLLGATRWALMHELRGEPEPTLDEIVARLAPCDLVLLEGFKQGDFPKLEVWRPDLHKPMLWPHWPGIVGIATPGGQPPRNDETGRPPTQAGSRRVGAPGVDSRKVFGPPGPEEGDERKGHPPASSPATTQGRHAFPGPPRLDLDATEVIADFVLAHAHALPR